MADFDLDSIDDIDYNMDFGFTTVDEDEVQEFETAVQEKVAKATQQKLVHWKQRWISYSS